ncbi:MAG: polya polymerase [Clostridiaceae bacterium]|nr:polya polymerase [Clostridiaceae bacterium]
MPSNQTLVDEFSRIMNQCRGQVVFVTEEGDRLVANSMLSALVGLSTILSIAEEMPMHVECELPEDYDRIISFMKKYKLNTHQTSS